MMHGGRPFKKYTALVKVTFLREEKQQNGGFIWAWSDCCN